jgi:hypothetical protein
VFNRTAPIIKLPEDATEEDHLALLGYLNSSTACFWLKQVCADKGVGGIGGGIGDEMWEPRYEFDGSKIGKVPLTKGGEIWRATKAVDELARRRMALSPAQRISDYNNAGQFNLARDLELAEVESLDLLARMVSLQEELDWMVYEAFGLLTEKDLALLHQAQGEAFPGFPVQISTSSVDVRRQGLWPGHRPFEVVLARDSLTSGVKTAWFARNNYWSPSEATKTYAPAYCRLIDARITIIDRNKNINIIERPEYKRRWTVGSYRDETVTACKSFLLDAAERSMKADITTTRQLAHELQSDPKVQAVAEVLTGESAPDLEKLFTELIGGEAVPYAAALRYSDTGLEKRADWERTWELQRLEDSAPPLPSPLPLPLSGEVTQRAGETLEIPVPPKYAQKDFRSQISWRHRGKLDVPKERFIAFTEVPGAEGEKALYGWAGWSPRERTRVLLELDEKLEEEGVSVDDRIGVLHGAWFLLPWVEWESKEAADEARAIITSLVGADGVTEGMLAKWAKNHPPPAKAKRSKKRL